MKSLKSFKNRAGIDRGDEILHHGEEAWRHYKIVIIKWENGRLTMYGFAS